MNLKIITVATKEIVSLDSYKYLKESLNKITLDHEFITLGSEDEWNGGQMEIQPGGGKKVIYLKEYLNNNKFAFVDYILFCDGSDTFCNGVITKDDLESIPPNEVILQLKHLIGQQDLEDKFKNLSPAKAYNNKYLNSGLFVGRANYIKSLLNKYDLIDYDLADTRSRVDDQYYYQNIFLENQNRISLDYIQKWFRYG